jgi:hypothetical protein
MTITKIARRVCRKRIPPYLANLCCVHCHDTLGHAAPDVRPCSCPHWSRVRNVMIQWTGGLNCSWVNRVRVPYVIITPSGQPGSNDSMNPFGLACAHICYAHPLVYIEPKSEWRLIRWLRYLDQFRTVCYWQLWLLRQYLQRRTRGWVVNNNI